MDGTWETLAFCQNGESVWKVSHIVLMRYILGLDWRVSLQNKLKVNDGVSKNKKDLLWVAQLDQILQLNRRWCFYQECWKFYEYSQGWYRMLCSVWWKKGMNFWIFLTYHANVHEVFVVRSDGFAQHACFWIIII